MELPQWKLDPTIPVDKVPLCFTQLHHALTKLLASCLGRMASPHSILKMSCGKTTFGTGGSIVWLSHKDTPLSSTHKTHGEVPLRFLKDKSQKSTIIQCVMSSLGLPAIRWLSKKTHRFLQQSPTGAQLLPLERLTLRCLTVFHRAPQRQIQRPRPTLWTSQWTRG